MTSDDAFSERFLQAFDWIAIVQGAEGRRDLKRAGANPIDGVTLRATSAHKDETSLRGRRKRLFA